MANTKQKVILCADDFAISPGVSLAITELIKNGRVTAASCMSISPFWKEHVSMLHPFRNSIDLGIHFTFTSFRPLGEMPILAPDGVLPSYRHLFWLSIRGKLNLKEIKQEMLLQLDSFEKAWGGPPDFLDGHMFIHHLPGIRKALIAVYRERFSGTGVYIRSSSAPLAVIYKRRAFTTKALAIGYFGWKLKKMGERYKIPFNTIFSGIYDFSTNMPYPELFEKFLTGVQHRSVIMCHPGIADDILSRVDNLSFQREREYEFFKSNRFVEILEKAGIELGRFY